MDPTSSTFLPVISSGSRWRRPNSRHASLHIPRDYYGTAHLWNDFRRWRRRGGSAAQARPPPRVTRDDVRPREGAHGVRATSRLSVGPESAGLDLGDHSRSPTGHVRD